MKLNACGEIKKILFITLSNIGDCILTFPVFDVLRQEFPKAEIDVVVGPKAQGLFEGNPSIKRVIVFDKRQNAWAQLRWALSLRREKFDLIVDLRNTAIPLLVGAKYRTAIIIKKENHIHMRQKHLNRLKAILGKTDEARVRFALPILPREQEAVKKLMSPNISLQERFAVIAPGAANHLKRWKPEGFAQAADSLAARYNLKIIFVGDKHDEPSVEAVVKEMKSGFLNLCGKTTLKELAALVARASLVMANDSGTMHMASYLDIPAVAIFGPSDHVKYGPWGKNSCLVKSDARCAACEKPRSNAAHECMERVSVAQVLDAAKNILTAQKS